MESILVKIQDTVAKYADVLSKISRVDAELLEHIILSRAEKCNEKYPFLSMAYSIRLSHILNCNNPTEVEAGMVWSSFL